MRGIIIKPSLCCGSTRSLGKVVSIVGEEQPHKTTSCINCSSKTKADNHYLIVDSTGKTFCCNKGRIKLLPDDEIFVEEEEKEVELT